MGHSTGLLESAAARSPSPDPGPPRGVVPRPVGDPHPAAPGRLAETAENGFGPERATRSGADITVRTLRPGKAALTRASGLPHELEDVLAAGFQYVLQPLFRT